MKKIEPMAMEDQLKQSNAATAQIDPPEVKDQPTKKKVEHKRGLTNDYTKNRKVGRWYLGETLGKGGCSWVKKGYDRQDGRIVALKFASKVKGNWSHSKTKQLQNEIEALRQIKHKNVLQLLAYNLNAKYPQKDGTLIPTFLLVLEYLPGGELFDFLYYTHVLDENIARTYFNQLINGLTACHNGGICHRNIKPQNLLLDSDFTLKIADFGLAKIFGQDNDNWNQTFDVGTRGYQAPEILNNCKDLDPYSFECDIFSCGVVLFILLAGYPPFQEASSKCRWYAPLAAGNAREFWKQHRGSGIPSVAKDLITRMLWCDKNKRITIKGIKKHKWYNGETLSTNQLMKELKTLHRKMEVERRYHAAKQPMMKESRHRYRGLPMQYDVKSVVIVDKKLDDLSILNCNDEKSGEKIIITQIKNGDTICNCLQIDQVVLKSHKAGITLDCSNDIRHRFFNAEKKELYCDNIASRLIKMYNLDSPQWKQIEAAGDAVIYVDYLQARARPQSSAPLFPEGDMVGFRDVLTQCAPKFTLQYIGKIVTNLGGEANIDLQDYTIEAKLATHNFPTVVIIGIRMYFSQTYNAHIVRFERISGDVLHFTRVLRKFVPQCGYVLTGLSDQEYSAVETKHGQEQNDTNQDCVDDCNIAIDAQSTNNVG